MKNLNESRAAKGRLVNLRRLFPYPPLVDPGAVSSMPYVVLDVIVHLVMKRHTGPVPLSPHSRTKCGTPRRCRYLTSRAGCRTRHLLRGRLKMEDCADVPRNRLW